MTTPTKVSEDTQLAIPIKNLIGILVAVVVSATAYYNITQRITFNEHQREVQWDKIRYLEDWIHTFEPSESIQRAMQVQQILQVRVAVLEERVDQLEEDLDFYGISYD
jgi:hypothetical protein